MTIFADGDDKSVMFQQRYNMLHQNLLLDSRFSDSSRGCRGADFPMISSDPNATKAKANESSLLQIHSKSDTNWRVQLTPPESLSGSIGTKVVFGMLCKGSDGKFYIEDNHQSAQLRLDNCVCSDDLITDNTFVLLKGEVIDDIFHVSEMTVPPIPQQSLCEPTLNVGKHYDADEIDIDGSISDPPDDATIAVLSNVMLDSPETIDKLSLLFTGFEECDAVPRVFVLMGSFTACPFNSQTGDSYRSYQKVFEKFTQLLARHPITLERSNIVIVPGPNEPGYGILPQPPVSDILLRGLSARFPNVILSGNPCRMRFYNKKIIMYSGCIGNQRLAGMTHNEEGEAGEKVMRAVLTQMTLVPGPARNKAVIWNHDTAMRVYPPPNALFLSDKDVSPFQAEPNSETIFACMPSFAKDGEFHLYSPCQQETTLSSV